MRKERLLGGLLAVLGLLSHASAPAEAAPLFTPEDNVILSSYTVLSVVQVSTGDWRMFVTSDSFKVYSATSSDQVSWSLETGVRISTEVSSLDHSSITAMGVHRSTASSIPWSMFYVGISSTGLYSVIRATSSDLLTWSKSTETAVLQIDSGKAFIGSPSPIHVTDRLMHLFYIADKDGSGSDLSDMTIHLASSTDAGVTITTSGIVLSAEQAFGVSVTTLTDGRSRLWYTQPLSGETTASTVLTAIAASATPESFTKESVTVLSTASASAGFSPLEVLRGTDTFRWRLFTSYTQDGSTQPYVSTAQTLTPVITAFSPTSALKNQSAIPYTITGEIFSSTAPTVTFTQASSTFNATTVTVGTDLSVTGTFDAANRSPGFHTIVLTNDAGPGASLARALFIDVPGGEVSVVDNLFRPLKGGQAAVTVTVFQSGQLSARLYTLDGRQVATLFDGTIPEGSTSFNWNGRTTSGQVVASGVYLLAVRGPKIDLIEKIVVIK